MRIAMAGGTGFIGQYMAQYLRQQDYEVELWSRNPNETEYITSQGIEIKSYPKEGFPDNVDILINLSGETINQRWTASAKERIMNSRVQTTQRLIDLMKVGPYKPKLFINASAIGYYGASETAIFTEKDQSGLDFLAEVSKAWEETAEQASQLDVRLVMLRLGLVLGNGGALPKMLLPYRFFAGGRIGSGKQWASWVHIHDVARLAHHVIVNESSVGPFNATAPEPVSMDKLGRKIGEVLHKPHWLPAPTFAFRILFGEMADLLLKGQRVIPQKVQEQGFQFQFNDVESALRDLLTKK
jgi:uncharacterized protein (TIGR01777 family)